MRYELITLKVLDAGDGYVIPAFKKRGDRFYDNDGYVSSDKPLKEKLDSLGIKPGKRFYIIKADGGLYPRNNFDGIWSEKQLRDYQKGSSACCGCEYFNLPNWGWEHCSDCGDGMKIIASFFITKNYAACFGEPEDNEISGR